MEQKRHRAWKPINRSASPPPAPLAVAAYSYIIHTLMYKLFFPRSPTPSSPFHPHVFYSHQAKIDKGSATSAPGSAPASPSVSAPIENGKVSPTQRSPSASAGEAGSVLTPPKRRMSGEGKSNKRPAGPR